MKKDTSVDNKSIKIQYTYIYAILFTIITVISKILHSLRLQDNYLVNTAYS